MSPATTVAQGDPIKTPVRKKKRTPQEELKYLEGKAKEYKITPKEFYQIQALGSCSLQILVRIEVLQQWLKEHEN